MEKQVKLLFYSPLFGYVELINPAVSFEENRYIGHLVNEWDATAITDNGLEILHFRQGQKVWLSMDHFALVIPSDFSASNSIVE
jgi:hypothetical protein